MSATMTEPVDVTGVTYQFSAAAVVELTGITYRQLDHWSTMGYIGGGNPGVGQNRLWGAHDLAVIRHTLTLLEVGFVLPLAVSAARRHVDTGKPVVLGNGMVIAFTDALGPDVTEVPHG